MSQFIRKLNNTKGESGDGSFTLIIPKQWCEHHELRHGDELNLILDEFRTPSILITLLKKELKAKKIFEINFTEYIEGSALSRAVLRRYLDGYEIIRISNVPKGGVDRADTRQLIRKLSTKLVGSSPNERDTSFELQISSDLQSPIDLLEQLFRKTLFMFRDVIQAYTTYDLEIAREIIEMDDEADSLYFHIVRTLKIMLQDPAYAKKGEFLISDALDYRMVASNLENLADATEVIANEMIFGSTVHVKEEVILGINKIKKDNISKFTPELRESIIGIAGIFENGLSSSFRCFVENDEKKAVKIAKNRYYYHEMINKLYHHNLHPSLITMFDEAIDCIVDILELAGE